MQGRQGHGQSHDAAVGVGDDVAATRAPTLRVQGVQVVGVHLGDEQRHVGVHAVVAGVRDDGVALAGEAGFHLARHRGVEPREEHLRAEGPLAGGDPDVRHGVGGSAGQAPGAGFAIGSARRAVGGGQLRHLEPRMIGEELHEALADRSRRAQDADRNLHLGASLPQ